MKAKKGYKCLGCRHMQTNHDIVNDGDGVPHFVCPEGNFSNAGQWSPGFERYVSSPKRVTNSFGADETALLALMARCIMHGRDINQVRRHPHFNKLFTKLVTMNDKLQARRGSKSD